MSEQFEEFRQDDHRTHGHGHSHGECGHNHAFTRRLLEAQQHAKHTEHGSRLRRAVAIGAIGAARVAVSSFCPLDDIVPLAMQVLKPAMTAHGQDQLAILPRCLDATESEAIRRRKTSYSYPLEGPPPPEYFLVDSERYSVDIRPGEVGADMASSRIVIAVGYAGISGQIIAFEGIYSPAFPNMNHSSNDGLI